MYSRRIFLKNGGLALVSLGFAPAFLARTAAATEAIGVSAALSSIPSTIRLRPSVPSPAFVPGKRFTIAIRIASSARPGSAMPPTHAAPPAKASAPAPGRSCAWKSLCQPHALKAYAARNRRAEPTTSTGSA